MMKEGRWRDSIDSVSRYSMCRRFIDRLKGLLDRLLDGARYREPQAPASTQTASRAPLAPLETREHAKESNEKLVGK